jgi:ribosome-associated protein
VHALGRDVERYQCRLHRVHHRVGRADEELQAPVAGGRWRDKTSAVTEPVSPAQASLALSIVREVPIRGQMIRLGQLLKLAGVIDSGAEVKTFLATGPVWVNGEREARRGRQLHSGDVVRVGDDTLRVIATTADDR